VLCLDDLQWSDAGTIDLVHYCLARLTDLPIAWLLAARPAAAVEQLAHRLVRAGVLEQLELEALAPADVRQLAEEILADDRSASGSPPCCTRARQPVPVRGAFAGARGRRRGTRRLQQPRDRRDRSARAPLGERVIEERASRLPATAQEALGWATVLSEPFTFEELQAVGGEELGSTPESLAAAGFLSGDGDGRWSFVHSIVRDAAYLRLPEHERVRRDGVVADSLSMVRWSAWPQSSS